MKQDRVTKDILLTKRGEAEGPGGRRPEKKNLGVRKGEEDRDVAKGKRIELRNSAWERGKRFLLEGESERG